MATTGINGLYPPIFPQTFQPAFVLDEGRVYIYFNISNYNKASDYYDWVQVDVRNQNTNESVVVRNSSQVLYRRMAKNSARDCYQILLWTNAVSGPASEGGHVQDISLKVDQYYKVQIRFLDKEKTQALYNTSVSRDRENKKAEGYTDEQLDQMQEAGQLGWQNKIPPYSYSWMQTNLDLFSEWSEVCLIKPIRRPVINLNNWSQDYEEEGDTTFYLSDLTLTGSIVFQPFGNESEEQTSKGTETIKYYKIYLYDDNNVLLEQSETLYKNSDNQVNEIYYDIKYHFPTDGDLRLYKLKIFAVTNHLYKFSQEFEFQLNLTAFNTEPWGSISAIADEKGGRATITVDIDDAAQRTFNNNLFIRRSSSKNNFKNWQIIYIGEAKSSTVVHDYTVEPGIWYEYETYLKNAQGYKSTYYNTSNYLVMINPEDIFLTTKNYQLKVRFDPQINSFSHVVNESLITTLGSRYPFVRRNGKVNYRSFTLSGTISAFMDLREDGMKASYEDLFLGTTVYEKYKDYNLKNNVTLYNDYIGEKLFRDKVLDFLYADDVKLFRSTPQGNILVKIMSVSLTPNNSLGRLIYSFSCTLNEIDSCTFKNYSKYNIHEIGEENYSSGTYYLKYGEIQAPSVLATTSNVIQTRSSSNLVSAAAPSNIKSYLPSSSDELKDLIQNKLNLNPYVPQFYSVSGFKYFKVEFDSNPYPIVWTSKGGFSAANGYSTDVTTNTQANYFLGHLLSVNNNVFNTGKVYTLSDFDLSQLEDDLTEYDILEDDQDFQINDIYCINQKETGRFSYVALVKAELKRDAIPTKINNLYKIGQYWGELIPDVNLYSKILKKYSYQIKNKEKNITAVVQNCSKLSIEAKPGSVFGIQEENEMSENIHIINDTGLLTFDDKKTSIKNIVYKGRFLRENQDPNKNFVNLNDYEWSDIGEIYQSLDMIKNPIKNGVYKILKTKQNASETGINSIKTNIKNKISALFFTLGSGDEQWIDNEIEGWNLEDLGQIFSIVNDFVSKWIIREKDIVYGTDKIKFLKDSYEITILSDYIYQQLSNILIDTYDTYIYYSGNWYPFNKELSVVVCPSDGLINYFLKIIKRTYDLTGYSSQNQGGN